MPESTNPPDARPGLQLLLLLDAGTRLFIWAVSLAVALVASAKLGRWPGLPAADAGWRDACGWALSAILFVVIFNLVYVALLILIRLPIPTPREGTYQVVAGKIPDAQMIYAALISNLTKARYQAPFPGFLVFQIANLPPLVWLMNPIFGPRSRSCYVTDPAIIDPYAVEIGRNVVIGMGSLIGAHFQQQDSVTVKKTIIEDGALIGVNVAMSGVHVKRGAAVAAGSVVIPGTVIGENEYWSGNPARRRKDLRAGDGEATESKSQPP